MDHISEEESEYSNSIHSAEEDNTTDLTEDASIQKHEDYSIKDNDDNISEITNDSIPYMDDSTNVSER